MTPEPPSTPDGQQLPPRHRPTADNLAKDTTERDLWDLDDLVIGDTDGPPQASIEPIRRNRVPVAPEPRAVPAKPAEPKAASNIPVLGGRSSVMRRVSKADRGRNPLAEPAGAGNDPGTRPVVPSVDRVETTFDELEDWDDSVSAGISGPIEEVFDELSESVDEARVTAAPVETIGNEVAAEQVDEPPPQKSEEPEPAAVADDDMVDEFSPRSVSGAAHVTERPKLVLNGIEKIGMACLMLVLLVGGVWAYRNTVSKLDSGKRNTDTELPAAGSHVKLTKIETYWRAPVTTGDKREIVRRGVVLIPVVEVSVSGKGAVRLLFGDDKGNDVGDPMVRAVDGETTLVIPATVGFEDISAHAAYQAGLTKPWSVRVAEAPSSGASGADFKDLANARISPNLR